MIVETILAMLPALPTQDSKPNDVHDVAVEIASTTDDVDIAAKLVVTAYAETRFRRLVGDHGRAFGPYQLHDVPAWIGLDPHFATPVALERLLASAKACPSAPMAPYIGGCSVPAARRQSAYRMAIVAKAVKLALPKSSLYDKLHHAPMDRPEDRRLARTFELAAFEFRQRRAA